MSKIIRLNKFLSTSGIGSRRKCEEFIKEGKILINDRIITELGTKIDPEVDKIFFRGKGKILLNQSKQYYILNKPTGYITTMEDPNDRPTIKKLMPKIKERIFPVGRLDLNSRGIILLTNDGEMAYRLTHPKFKITKTYLAKLQGKIDTQTAIRLRKGVPLKDGQAKALSIKVIKHTKTNSWVNITLSEGRNQIVRRMFMKLGYHVLKLKRTQFAFLRLDMLKPGDYRRLTHYEISRLLKAVNLDTK